MNLKEHHKKYLRENNLNSINDVALHTEILKINNSNRQMMFDLVYFLINHKDCLESFFADEKRNRVNATRLKAEDCEDKSRFTYSIEAPVSFEMCEEDEIVEPKIYTFSWRPNKKTESTLNTKPVHSNPFVDENYCSRKKRIEDSERLKLQKMEVLKTESPIAPKQDLKGALLQGKPMHCNFTMCDDSRCVCCHPTKESILNNNLCDENKFKETEGQKFNILKPQLSLLFKQFPKALEAIVRCSEYGHEKYKETDKDYLNFKRVKGGSKDYADAGLRHRIQKGIDLESMLPHCYHVAWNALAELELLIENK